MKEPKDLLHLLPKAPAGKKFEYRGYRWKPDKVCDYAFVLDSCDAGSHITKGRTPDGSGNHYWELVDGEALPSLEEQIEEAKKLIGKRVLMYVNDPNVKVITHIDVMITGNESRIASYSNITAWKDGDKKPLVVLCSENNNSTFPYLSAILVPNSEKVKLNEKYVAEVFQDKIVVGCQTFPIEILDTLFQAHEKIS